MSLLYTNIIIRYHWYIFQHVKISMENIIFYQIYLLQDDYILYHNRY